MGVTDTQLYLAIGLPVFVVLINIVAGLLQHNAVMSRFGSVDSRFASLESQFNSRFASLEAQFNNRFSSVENRLTSIDARFETLTGKVIEIDNRLTRVEAILERR